MITVGVNGASGRIGKFSSFELFQISEIKVVALNDPVGAKALVENYKEMDSTHGRLDWSVKYVDDSNVEINGRRIKVYSEKDPKKIPWGDCGVGIVGECSGYFIKDGAAKAHLGDSIRDPSRVIVSAPATGEGLITLILGVNQEEFDPNKHSYISNASCTTKALATPIKCLMDVGIEVYALLMDTVHAATNTQRVLDFGDEPATLDNISLVKTGAAIATGEVIRELEGKMDGFAARVPTSDGSFANLYFVVSCKDELNASKVNDILSKATRNERYFGRIGTLDMEKVSSKKHVVGRRENALVVTNRTRVLPLPFAPSGKNAYLIGIVSGYDNERGPARDLALLVKYIGERCGYCY